MTGMKRSTSLAWSELKVGLLLVAALLIGTIAVVSFSGIREYFRPTFPLYTTLEQVSGLKPGAVVMLSGVPVGSVTELAIAPADQTGVRVGMSVYTSHQKAIRRDARASLGSQGLLGDKYIELDPGSGMAPPIGPGATITGYTAAGLDEVVGSAQDATTRLNEVLAELTGLTRDLRDGTGTAGRLLNDPALYDDARDVAQSLSGTAGDVTEAARTYRELGQRLEAALEADGTLGRLTRSPEPFERLSEALGRLDNVLARVEEGQGTLGQAVNDPQLMDEMTGLIQDIRQLVRKIDENPKKYLHFTVF